MKMYPDFTAQFHFSVLHKIEIQCARVHEKKVL